MERHQFYLKEASITVSLDPSLHCIEITWSGAACKQDFQWILEKAWEIGQHQLIQNWLLDLNELTFEQPPEPNWIPETWMEKVIHFGLEKWLVVVSAETFSKQELKLIAQRSVAERDTVAFFCNRAEARQYLQSYHSD